MRPIPAEDFSSIVGTIYDCALDPSLWSGVLASLCEAMRFHTSTLALQELPSGRLLLRPATGSPIAKWSAASGSPAPWPAA